ncbi:MAG TPA: glycosyl transferase [Firmicutes bacterium]|jgi:glycosyltransferase involved in cell wall biosynthesis|nr:glycosyl transferase [Bacillota bacterium]
MSDYFNKRSLLAMMAVRNEAERYLKPVLDRLSTYVDGIVILDDASTDGTPDLCRAHPKVIRFERLTTPLFVQNEAALRRKLWDLTVEAAPTWVLALDADEVLETRAVAELPHLLAQTRCDLITFPVYHFWGDLRHYRVDHWWHPSRGRTACLHRYQPNRSYHWPSRALHSGRFPQEAYLTPRLSSSVRLLHFGYADRTTHRAKYQRYLTLDPQGNYCPLVHYRSILDSHPQLKSWVGENMEALLWK